VVGAAVAVDVGVAGAEPANDAITGWSEDDRRLWDRLRAFDIDADGSTTDISSDEKVNVRRPNQAPSLSFTTRLTRENGWRASHAARVVEEYRRFLFLTAVSGPSVTPSETVDQA